jgi:hypothetical protein
VRPSSAAAGVRNAQWSRLALAGRWLRRRCASRALAACLPRLYHKRLSVYLHSLHMPFFLFLHAFLLLTAICIPAACWKLLSLLLYPACFCRWKPQFLLLFLTAW